MSYPRKNTQAPPVVMVFSGLDPTGGAGLQADIEAIASMGCHTAPIASCLTVQTTSNVLDVIPVEPTLMIEQARAVLEDIPVAGFKLGVMPTPLVVESVATILNDYPQVPVILDPVITAGGGGALADEAVVEALLELIVPRTTVITPNSHEVMALIRGSDSLDASAMGLLSHGCDYVLVTGAHRQTPRVVNTLYGDNRKLDEYSWPRLPNDYHGSGCTLASAIAGLMAQQQAPVAAIKSAQRYTWRALRRGSYLGMGQLIPNRLFWIDDEKD